MPVSATDSLPVLQAYHKKYISHSHHIQCNSGDASTWYVHTAIFKINNQEGPSVEHKELCSIWGKSLEKSESCICINWITLLYTETHIVDQLYSSMK